MICDECGWDVEGEGHSPTCSEETERCPNCGRDFEGCECSAEEGGIGHDSFRDDEDALR